MFIKYLILIATVIAYIQNGYADETNDPTATEIDSEICGDACSEANTEINTEANTEANAGNRIDNQSLEEAIEKMKSKVKQANIRMTFTFLAVDSVLSRFSPKNKTIDKANTPLAIFVMDKYNKTVEHYNEIEEKARVDGVLGSYSVPYLYEMKIFSENRDELIDILKNMIMASPKISDETKQLCVTLMSKVINFYFDFFDQLAKIEQDNPKEFSHLEETLGWDSMHHSITENLSPEVLRVHIEITTAIEKSEKVMKQFTGEMEELSQKLKVELGKD